MSNSIYKINWKISKKQDEQKFSDFFAERFNKTYNLNYRIVPNNEEADDVDIKAISKEGETLNLQLKTGEPDLERFWGRRKKLGSGWGIIDGNIEKLLNQIIKDAENHYANKEKLILLITEKHEPIFDKNYALRISNIFKSSSFKGIYIVNLPSFEGDYSSDGQVVAIKDMFGNHGKIF